MSFMQTFKQSETQWLNEKSRIEAWFNAEFLKTPPPPYCSVDLRQSGFKTAPVDTNLFPAGFNNIHKDSLPCAIKAAQKLALLYVKNCQRIVIVPENHTRNRFYFESLSTLQSIFQKAGFDIRIGSLLEEITQPVEIALPGEKKIILEPLLRKGDRVGLANFDPCFILLNHDLSEGIPAILKDISQKIEPPLELGWWSRKKSQHFAHYGKTALNFAKDFSIDPWFITPYFDTAENIDFVSRDGEDDLIQKTAAILEKIQKKYQEYHIDKLPYVVIKADAGTYGMGILSVQHPEKIRELNRKERSQMTSTKGNQKISRVIIQEGVYTADTQGETHASAEPVIYMIGDEVIGGFYRVHKDRKSDENLNAPGMHFEPFPSAKVNYVYSVISRLALLAAAQELHGVQS
jgi:glutamate--cysteine ligase